MTPKEKAKDIFDKMAFEICDTDAKKCALICINEMIDIIDKDVLSLSAALSRRYLEDVKIELENLN